MQWWWPHVVPLLESPIAYADDGTTLEEVKEQLLSQESMLWVGLQGSDLIMALVLTVENHALYAWLIGGKDMNVWLDELLSHMTRYAKEHQLKGLKAITRPGLARKLRQKGWRTDAEIVKVTL